MKALLSAVFFTFYATAFTFAQEPNWAMAFQIGSKNSDQSQCLTTDGSNNLYVTGRVFDTTCFPQFHCFPNLNNFLAKFDASGQFTWVKNIASDYGFTLKDATTDATGNIILTGSFTDTLIIGSQTLVSHGSTDILLLKYDSSGNMVWVQNTGGTGQDQGVKIVTDAPGNIYVTGNAGDSGFSSMPFPGGQFLAKYDKDGNEKWVSLAGSVTSGFFPAFNNYAFGLDIDLAGNLYTCGSYKDSILLGNILLKGVGNEEILLVKFDNNGDPLWARSAGGHGTDKATDLAVDNYGNPFLVGIFRDSAFFGTTQIKCKPNARFFMAKYTTNGTLLFVDTLGNGYPQKIPRVFADNDGNAYVSNVYNSIISKYNGNGNLLWAKAASVAVSTGITDLTIGNNGSFYFVGAFNPEVFLPPYSLYSFGNEDIFVAGLASTTSLHEVENIGNGVVVYPNPNKGSFTIKFNTNSYDALEITDMFGRIIYEQSISSQQPELKIALHNIAPGIYFLQLSGKRKVRAQRILVE